MLTGPKQKEQVSTEFRIAEDRTTAEPVLGQAAEMGCSQSGIRRRSNTGQDHLPGGTQCFAQGEKRLQKCGGERNRYWHEKGSWGLGTRDWLSRPRGGMIPS